MMVKSEPRNVIGQGAEPKQPRVIALNNRNLTPEKQPLEGSKGRVHYTQNLEHLSLKDI
jgi:hypothetical protein